MISKKSKKMNKGNKSMFGGFSIDFQGVFAIAVMVLLIAIIIIMLYKKFVVMEQNADISEDTCNLSNLNLLTEEAFDEILTSAAKAAIIKKTEELFEDELKWSKFLPSLNNLSQDDVKLVFGHIKELLFFGFTESEHMSPPYNIIPLDLFEDKKLRLLRLHVSSDNPNSFNKSEIIKQIKNLVKS